MTTKTVSYIFNINNIETIRKIDVEINENPKIWPQLQKTMEKYAIETYIRENIVNKEFIIPVNGNQINIKVYKITKLNADNSIETSLIFQGNYLYTSKLELFAKELIVPLHTQLLNKFNEGTISGEPYQGTPKEIALILTHDFDFDQFYYLIVPNTYVDESWYLERQTMINASMFTTEQPTDNNGRNGFNKFILKYIKDYLKSKDFIDTVEEWIESSSETCLFTINQRVRIFNCEPWTSHTGIITKIHNGQQKFDVLMDGRNEPITFKANNISKLYLNT